ncbi:MAG: PfkB family carbohydrate kinase [Acidimicrobiaceae bacterium]|nr:PfkB family carbohydrate kinase [Acidimicrobiaceae bacterium]
MPPTAIVIGEAMIELWSSADEPGRAYGQDESRRSGEPHGSNRFQESDGFQLGGFHGTFAGDTLNCAAAIAAVDTDISVRYLTGVGEGERSSQLIDFCASMRVDASGSMRVPNRQLGVYWIETGDTEQRFRYQRDKSAARAALSRGMSIPPVGPGDAVILSGITLAVATTGCEQLIGQLAQARASGALTGFDLNYRTALWADVHTARVTLEAMLEKADIVKASVDDTRNVWNEDAVSFCRRATRSGASEVIVTNGHSELLAVTGDEHRWYQPSTVDVVDTSGAGDGFFGTYLAHRLSDVDPFEAIHHSLEVAAHVVRSNGALGYLTDTMQ